MGNTEPRIPEDAQEAREWYRRRFLKNLPPDEQESRADKWLAEHLRKESNADAAINRRVALWCQRERIVAYLPRLHEQREEALRRLADLDQLIADEEAAVEAIEKQVA